jgi:hypothetical protein
MKKIAIQYLLALCITEISLAQSQDEQVRDHYTNKVLGQFIAFDAGLGALNYGFGYGFQLDGFVGKRFSGTVGFSRNGYTDGNASDGNSNETSEASQGIDPAGYFQANFHFHLIDKMGKGKIKWERMGNHTGRVPSDPNATYTTIYTSKGMVRKILAVRGGIYNWKSGVKPEAEDEWFLLPAGSSTPVQATEKSFTTLSSKNVTAGLSYGKLVDADRFGRHVSYLRTWYADVFVNTSVSMDDITSSTGATAVYQIGKGNLNKETIGWRVGWEYIALARKYIIMSYKIEGGKRPGVTDRSPYFQVTIGLGTKYATKGNED